MVADNIVGGRMTGANLNREIVETFVYVARNAHKNDTRRVHNAVEFVPNISGAGV